MSIEYETFEDGGAKYYLIKIKNKLVELLAGKVDTDAVATDSTLGLIKTNSAQAVTLGQDGELIVGGRLGQYPNGGVYYPVNIEPTEVKSSTFLMSDGAKNLSLGILALWQVQA